MEKQVKVYMNHVPWDFGYSTDRNMRLLFKGLESRFEDLCFYYPQDWRAGIIPAFKHLLNAVRCRLLPICKGKYFTIKMGGVISRNEFKRQHFDVVYSQGVVPIVPKRETPLLLDLYFIDPEQANAHVTEASLEGWKQLIEDMKEVSKMNCIINLRSDYSLQLVEKYFPESRHKFVNLPFLLPNLSALPSADILQKHTDVSIFKIAFVGAQAKRKGLDLLLAALDILYNKRNVRHIELNIVSGCTDGDISIPSNLPVVYHGAKDYAYTMNIMKQSHIYVMPSRVESYGLSYIEAMANGCVVLARNYEPQREIVNYGKAGLLIELNPNDIADKLQYVVEMNENERKEIALNAVERFISKYEYSVVSEQWYKEIKRCSSLT